MAEAHRGWPAAFSPTDGDEDLAGLRRRGRRQVAALAVTMGRLRRLQADVECHMHGRYGRHCPRCATSGGDPARGA